MPVIFGGIAQSVEQMAVNHQVVGSNPTATAKKRYLKKPCLIWNHQCMGEEEKRLSPVGTKEACTVTQCVK